MDERHGYLPVAGRKFKRHTMRYQIRIKGHLGDQWVDWFEGMTITLEENGDTLLTGRCDLLQIVHEAQWYGVPPYLRLPGEEGVLPGLAALEVAFGGGPVVAFKVADDGKRLILRLWNVLDRPEQGTARLPEGCVRAEQCDALKRRIGDLGVERGRMVCTVSARGIGTVAFCRA
jgi:hypothetical protein